MIFDAHTHIFPPELREDRDDLLRRDAGFRELYANPKAKMATAGELLASMDGAGVDRSVICGYAWAEQELCRRHNDYLLEAASASGGRLLPFAVVQPSGPDARRELERCAAAGARGIGELRPLHQGYRLIESPEAALLAAAARDLGLVVLFHASEPVGHAYPGKTGLALDQLERFILDHPDVTVIAAHWGGGLPFYALMPEVRASLRNTYFDTASTHLLYSPEVYRRGIELVGTGHVLFGSDFPLVSQARALAAVRAAAIDDEARALVLGGNAARLLDLNDG